MEFQPKSERELRAEMLLPDGEYDFEVVKAENKLSANGNDMIALTMKVWDHNAAERTMRDWLVNSDHVLCQIKIRHFCESTGLLGAYDSGSLDAYACEGAAGRLSIGSREDKQYGPQNTVQDYLHDVDQEPQVAPGPTAGQTKRANDVTEDDTIPF